MAQNVTNFRGEIYFTPNGNLHIKDEPVTPIEEDFGDHNHFERSFEECIGIKKSLSMSDITTLREEFANLKSCEHEDLYNKYRKPSTLPQELSKTKFVSMAEAIYHYQRDTPGRFHSTRPKVFQSRGPSGPSGLTIPQSPRLRCKARSRPVHILSQKEKEDLEMEEIKKFKIKAHPIPKSVIEGPIHLPEVQKKPITVPEPFKLTEIHHKKEIPSSDFIQNFKARPAPKHILQKPHIPVKPPVQIIRPVSPKFHYKRVNSADNIGYNVKFGQKSKKTEEKAHIRMGPLKPEPFSFEKRDEELKRRRQERIKQQIEEERKQACCFKAQPVPGMVKKRMHCTAIKSSSSTSSENKENFRFEAKPPTVLYKEPFKPILKSLQLIKPSPFALTTEKRAAEREQFDKRLKEKEEEQERLRQQREREQLEAEERARAELRAKLVHHAKPVPAIPPFHLEKSVLPLTMPETPKFVRRLKEN